MSNPGVYTRAKVLAASVSLLAICAGTAPASAQVVSPAIDVCSGVSVNLPTLAAVPTVGAGVIGALPVIGGLGLSLDSTPITGALNGVVNGVNTNIINQLNSQPISVSVLDANTNTLVSVPSSNCTVAVNNPNGISLGGGRINGLGGTGNLQASAGDASAIAIGNNAATTANVADAIAFGTNANATTAGSVALGANSIANRSNAAAEAFGGAGLNTAVGVVSVGSAGNERQITNVAGGTAPTDATNVRQLRFVGNSVANSLGGGSAFDGTTGAYTGPSYTVGSTTYTDVGSAIAALQTVVSAPGLVLQATPTAPITVGAATGGTSVSFAGTAGPRTLTGVAPGALGAGSTAAVNGAQLFTTNTGLNGTVAALGGGTSFNAGTNTYTAPTYAIRGAIYDNVGSALAALDAAIPAGGGGGSVEPIAGNSPDGNTNPLALGPNSVAGGYQAMAMGAAGSALGDAAQAMGDFSTSIGGQSIAAAVGSTALGAQSSAMDLETTAIGGRAMARFQGSVAIGANAQATADPTTAVGYFASATGNDAVAIGAYSTASGTNSAAIGTYSSASGANATAVGIAANAGANDSVAIGYGASSTVAGGVAIGMQAVADRMNSGAEAFSNAGLRATLGTVSFGSAGNERQLTNVAGGTADTDAVNVRQLRTVGGNLATSLGGGAGFDPGTGIYTAPSYTVSGNIYRDVGGAIGALDATGVRYDIDPATGGRSNAITLAGADPNTPVLIRNVARGVAPTDAANVGQVREAVQEANNYTDARIASSLGNVQSLAQLQQDVRQVRREARQAAAIGLAASSLRFDGTPGKVSLAAGGGAWLGEAGAAFGIGYTSLDGRARLNVSTSTADGKWGVGGGLSVTLN